MEKVPSKMILWTVWPSLVSWAWKSTDKETIQHYSYFSDNILSKHGYKVRAKFFLEFDDFEDIFNHCILPLFEELGQVNDSNKAELEAHFEQFWSSFNDFLYFKKRMSLVKKFFQTIANNFQQTYNLIALKNNQLELTSIKSIKQSIWVKWFHNNPCTRHDSYSTTANILYIYDKYYSENGFLILDKLENWNVSNR